MLFYISIIFFWLILVFGVGEFGMFVIWNFVCLVVSYLGIWISVMLWVMLIDLELLEKQWVVDEICVLGVNIVVGDLVIELVEVLVVIFVQFDIVIGCIGYVVGCDMLMKVVCVVVKLGIFCYFFWQFGVDFDVIGCGGFQDLFDVQLDVCEYLCLQIVMDWVIIFIGMFISYFFELDFGVVDLVGYKVNVLGLVSNVVILIMLDDIGVMIVCIVFYVFVICNEIVYLVGDIICYGDFLDILQKVFGEFFELVIWGVFQFMQELVNDLGNMIKKYCVVFV